MFKDTGIGIAHDNFETIFQEFRQVSEGYGRSYEGAGLGLTISRKIIEIMGGKIEVVSESGLGSIFTVWIPSVNRELSEDGDQLSAEELEEATQPVVEIRQPVALPTILVVEDNDDNAEIVRLYLKSRFQVDRARDGKSALKMISETPYQAVLMDINLGGGLDGLKIAREIRKHPMYNETPIIAITGYTMSGDKESILASGCTHYLPKPFTKYTINEVMDQVFPPVT